MKDQGLTEKALWSAFFTYGQFFIAFAAVFFVTPLILRLLGPRQYGLWLSSGELVGFFLLLDFGVFSVLPWLIARTHGAKRTDELKQTLAQAFAIALSMSVIFLCLLGVFYNEIPRILHITAADWTGLGGPLCLLVILLGLNLPVSVFASLLNGLQDVRFIGPLNLTRTVVGPLLTIILLLNGQGFYALAIGAVVLSPLVGIGAFFRARAIVPELLEKWPRPSFSGTVRLFRESIGAWLSSAGVQMIERTSAVVLTYLRFPAIVPVLVCTSRLGQTLTQMAWVMPDSALVGFSQLTSENRAERTREVALSIIKLNLVLAGFASCLVLAINPIFVRIWVGERFFGGLLLNFLLAAEVITGTITHALATIVAVHGARLSIGIATVLQGVIFVGLALTLTRRFALTGLLIADLSAPLLSTIPLSIWLLHSSLGFSPKHLLREIMNLLFLPVGPCLVVACAYGVWRGQNGWLLEALCAGVLIGFLYLKLIGPQLAAFPFPVSARLWLQRFRLI